MALRGKKPEEIQKRLKLMLYGDAGVGKTRTAIQFPKAFYIDCERGAENASYVRALRDAGSVVFQTSDYEELLDQLTCLATEKHDFKTVVIDPVTIIENNIIERAEKIYSDGMKVWGHRDKCCKRICSKLRALDMNVICTMHGGVEYDSQFRKIGTKYEGWKRWKFEFDLSLELRRSTSDRKMREAFVAKTRVETFPDGELIPFSYAEFKKRYGADTLERSANIVTLASPEQVAVLNHLLNTVKVEDGWLDRVLEKAAAEDVADLTHDQITKCIEALRKKML